MPENFETAMELLRLRRLREHVWHRREQMQERVGHYPNAVNRRQLAALVAEQNAVEQQITELEATLAASGGGPRRAAPTVKRYEPASAQGQI
jgi:hypothetical protein